MIHRMFLATGLVISVLFALPAYPNSVDSREMQDLRALENRLEKETQEICGVPGKAVAAMVPATQFGVDSLTAWVKLRTLAMIGETYPGMIGAADPAALIVSKIGIEGTGAAVAWPVYVFENCSIDQARLKAAQVVISGSKTPRAAEDREFLRTLYGEHYDKDLHSPLKNISILSHLAD